MGRRQKVWYSYPFQAPRKLNLAIVPLNRGKDLGKGVTHSPFKQAGATRRTYLVVSEKSTNCWGAFAPDIGGAIGTGDTIRNAHMSVREGIDIMLGDFVERGFPMPEALSTSVDFSDFNPEPEQSQYVIEWLTVDLPEAIQQAGHKEQRAA